MIEMLLVGDDGVEINLDTSFIGYSSTNQQKPLLVLLDNANIQSKMFPWIQKRKFWGLELYTSLPL